MYLTRRAWARAFLVLLPAMLVFLGWLNWKLHLEVYLLRLTLPAYTTEFKRYLFLPTVFLLTVLLIFVVAWASKFFR
jgi:hypothetical protein